MKKPKTRQVSICVAHCGQKADRFGIAVSQRHAKCPIFARLADKVVVEQFAVAGNAFKRVQTGLEQVRPGSHFGEYDKIFEPRHAVMPNLVS